MSRSGIRYLAAGAVGLGYCIASYFGGLDAHITELAQDDQLPRNLEHFIAPAAVTFVGRGIDLLRPTPEYPDKRHVYLGGAQTLIDSAIWEGWQALNRGYYQWEQAIFAVAGFATALLVVERNKLIEKENKDLKKSIMQ